MWRKITAVISSMQTSPQAILEDCKKAVENMWRVPWPLDRDERYMQERAALLKKAAAAGLSDHATVRRLEFVQRLVNTLGGSGGDGATKDALLAEAKRHELSDMHALRGLAAARNLERLAEHGLAAIAHDAQGRAVYLQCEANFKNKTGQWEVRDDGATFTGEVVLDIVWSNVAHAAKTTHTYQGDDYRAVAFQEGKRRTATKVVFPWTDHSEFFLRSHISCVATGTEGYICINDHKRRRAVSSLERANRPIARGCMPLLLAFRSLLLRHSSLRGPRGVISVCSAPPAASASVPGLLEAHPVSHGPNRR